MSLLPIIPVNRVVLTSFTSDDVEVVTNECTLTQNQRYLYLPNPYTESDATEWVNCVISNYNVLYGEICWAIRKVDNGELLGTFTLRQNGTLGFWMCKNARGYGYLAEAIRGAMGYFYNLVFIQNIEKIGNFTIPKIWIHDAMNANIGSCRVAYKLGFAFKYVRPVPDKVVDGQVLFSAKRYHRITQYQNYSEFDLINHPQIDRLIMKNSTLRGEPGDWPALIRYAPDMATDIENFFDRLPCRLDGSNDRTQMAKSLLDRIGIGGKYVDCTVSAKTHTLTRLKYDTLLKIAAIPYGETAYYSDIDPNRPRIVGNICKYNPFPIIIPCHRVQPKSNDMGSYAFGEVAKRHYLALESVENVLNSG